MIWLALIALPFVAALHRYACLYGYGRADRREALRAAWQVWLVVAAVCAVLAVVHALPRAS